MFIAPPGLRVIQQIEQRRELAGNCKVAHLGPQRGTAWPAVPQHLGQRIQALGSPCPKAGVWVGDGFILKRSMK